MLKKIGIAFACGIAVYGLVKLVGRHALVVAEPIVRPISEHAVDTSASEEDLTRGRDPQDKSVAVAGAGASVNEHFTAGPEVLAATPAGPAGAPTCA